MYAFIRGEVFKVNGDHIIVETGGIGYRIFITNKHSLKKGQNVLIYIYQQIKEDAHVLFGFLSEEEYALFMLLISVKGVGCKSALGILNGAKVEEILSAIENSDATFMKRMPGVGAKTASQIILDLKGKLVISDDGVVKNKSTSFSEVEGALKSLGYKTSEINAVLRQLPSSEESVDKLLKTALGIILKAKGG